MKRWTAGLALVLAMVGAERARAAIVALQQATATYSQGSFGVEEAIDGSYATWSGWAIHNGSTAQSQVAAFETVSDVGFSGGTLLTFTFSQLDAIDAYHLLGMLRLSLTQADRASFADGLSTGGNVGTEAIWTQLQPISALSSGGVTLTIGGDNTVLSGGARPATATYTVTAATNLTNITGFRLEVLEDARLPDAGPGRYDNGNFVLTEFTVDAAPVPEPASLAIWSLFGGVGVIAGCRRKRNAT